MKEIPNYNDQAGIAEKNLGRKNGVEVKVSTFLSEQLGVIATQNFQQGDLIFTIKGPITSNRTKYSFQFSKNQHIEPANENDGQPSLGHHLNHSCDPNVAIKIVNDNNDSGYIKVIAISDIRTGQEVTVDYASMEYETTVDKHPCRCRSAQCRGHIGGYKDLPPKIKEKYKTKGFIPLHLLMLDEENDVTIQKAN